MTYSFYYQFKEMDNNNYVYDKLFGARKNAQKLLDYYNYPDLHSMLRSLKTGKYYKNLLRDFIIICMSLPYDNDIISKIACSIRWIFHGIKIFVKTISRNEFFLKLDEMKYYYNIIDEINNDLENLYYIIVNYSDLKFYLNASKEELSIIDTYNRIAIKLTMEINNASEHLKILYKNSTNIILEYRYVDGRYIL